MERLSAPALLPEALQEVLIAPAERARPLASTHSVLRGGRHPEGTLVLEAVLGEEGSRNSLETTVTVSSALIAWDEKKKKRAQVSALGFQHMGSFCQKGAAFQ